jgi:hypothetical protein
MYSKLKTIRTAGFLAAVLLAPIAVIAEDMSTQGRNHQDRNKPHARRQLVVTTQGPLWPPSTFVDSNGDFVVLGNILTKMPSGKIEAVPGAALVSKNTKPPLDANGREDFSNFMAAPYQVIRRLDLRRGSKDLDIELYTPSYGPPKGNFGGGPRIPMEGDSRYNLNPIPTPCPELFPAASQEYTYTRPSFPVKDYPILGFQGDQVAYDVDTGAPYDPKTRSGPSCGLGCSGEDMLDERSDKPVTLGDWVRARGEMEVTLTRYDHRVKAYTAARFKFKLRNLLPRSLYTFWALRQSVFTFGHLPGPYGLPSSVMTDDDGNAEYTVELNNPFPDRAKDPNGHRVVGVEMEYHPDQQNWGACGERWGIGFRILSWFDFLPDGSRDLSNLVTRERT